MLLLTTFVFAQRIIKGKVTEAGEAVIGANVIAKGTKATTTTDIEGNYRLSVPKEATQIEFTYVGMASQLITLGASDIVDVVLRPDKALEEVVVIGYGTQKRKDLTGSVTSITSENFVKGPIQTPEQLISGKVAGVQITSNGGRPGGGSTIRIRGGSSLNASNDPLIVIDGVPVDNGTINGASNPLSFINPSDVESITVLKDASATAIYGSRASNGVILIVTKRGGKEIRGSFSSQLTYSEVTKVNPVLTGDEFRTLVNNDLMKLDTVAKKLLGKENTDWQRAVLRNAYSADNNLSISGTAYDVLPFRVSFNVANFQGVLKNSEMRRNGLAVGLSPKLFNNHLKVDVNYKRFNVKNRFSDQGALGSAVGFDPTQPIRTGSSNFGGYYEWLNPEDKTPWSLAPRNPVSLVEGKTDESEVVRSIGNVQLDYKFHFLPALKAVLNLGMDNSNGGGNKLTPATLAASYFNGGYTGSYTQEKTNKLLDFYFNYAKDFKNSKLDATLGHSYQDFISSENSIDKDGNRDDAVVTYYKTQNTLLSFFGRANYNIAEKYLFTGTLRYDGSSKFSPETRWGLFPSAAFAWKLKEEGFLKDSRLFSDLKLRLGYGVTGQQDVLGNYPYLPLYTLSQPSASYQLGNTFYNTLRPAGYAADLKWEETTTYNVGLDYGFANGRIFGSVDVYNRLTKDLLSEVNVPAGTNLTNRILTNVGNLTNKGVEFVVSVLPIQTEKTSWSVSFNATVNKNQITNLSLVKGAEKPPVFETGGIAGGVGNNIQANTVDYSRNTFRVYQQVYGTNGKPIEGLYVDRNGDGQINSDDLYLYGGGSPDPKLFLGMSSNFSHGAFSAGFAMRANVGNYVYNNFKSGRGVVDYYNQQGFLINQNPEVNVSSFNKFNYFSDYYLENASFLRMDNIYLGYRLTDKRHNPNVSTTLTFSVQNVFTITNYSGIDPEQGNGIDNNIYPRPRIYALGVKLDW